MRKHWHKLLRNMPAAKHIHDSCAGQRFNIIARLSFPARRARTKERQDRRLRNILCKKQARVPRIYAHVHSRTITELCNKPGILLHIKQPGNIGEQRKRCSIPARKERKCNHDLSAADHADVRDLVRRKVEALRKRLPAQKRLLGKEDALMLHRAAADRPAGLSAGKNGHLRAAAARRGAGACNDRAEHRILATGNRIPHRFKQLFHIVHAAGLSTAPMELATKASYCASVSSLW